MSGKYTSVPYGYEPPAASRKGTLTFYDSFEHVTDEQLERASAMVDTRSFIQLVLYPLHESTFKRMSKDSIQAYYKEKTACMIGGENIQLHVYVWRGLRARERNIHLWIARRAISLRNIQPLTFCI